MIHRSHQAALSILCLYAMATHANQHLHGIIGRQRLFRQSTQDMPFLALTIQYLAPRESDYTYPDRPFRRIIPLETEYVPLPEEGTPACLVITRDIHNHIIIRSLNQERRYNIPNDANQQHDRPEYPDLINLMQPEGTIWQNDSSSESDSSLDSPQSNASPEPSQPDNPHDESVTAMNGSSGRSRIIITPPALHN